MPKFNREQRFAVLKNIYDELGDAAALRQSARLQIPSDEARNLISLWKSGAEPEPEPEGGHAERLKAREAVRPQRVQRSMPRVYRPAAPERVQRPVTAAEKPARVQRPVTAGKPVLPTEKETGGTQRGYDGCALRQGSHVTYKNTDASLGVIVKLGPEQSEVRWARSGVTKAEVNTHLWKA